MLFWFFFFFRLAYQRKNFECDIKGIIAFSTLNQLGLTIQSAREVSKHFWKNANFCLFIVCNLKDVGQITTNKRPKLETQWSALC